MKVMAAGAIEPNNLSSAELNLIQIRGEQFLLADRPIESAGVPNLRSLALQFAERVTPLQIMKYEVLEELHRDSAPPTTKPTTNNGGQCDQIDPAMVHETTVFDSNNRLLHRLRDFVRLEHYGA